jgi:hypothetical protein
VAVAFDATSEFDLTSSAAQNHTPVGTPKAVLVRVAANTETSDVISGVTYGGVAMARLAHSVTTAGNEDGSTWIYFLGESIPTGTQSASVSVSSGTTAKRAWVSTFTATTDATESACTPQTYDSGSASSTSITLPTTAGFAGAVVSVCFAGLGNCSNLSLPSEGSYSLSGTCRDFGSQVAKSAYRTGLSGANITVTWGLSSSEDVSCSAVAIQEKAGGTAHSLAGTADGTSTTTGTIAAGWALAAAATGASTATAALPVDFALAGTAAGTSSTSAVLSPTFALIGSAAGASTAAAAITYQAALAGTADGVSTASGAITGAFLLAGTSDATSSAAGDLVIAFPLIGTSDGTSSAAAALTAAKLMAGSADGTSSAAADLILAYNMLASASGIATTTATMNVDWLLAATSAGTSSATGILFVLEGGQVPIVASFPSIFFLLLE